MIYVDGEGQPTYKHPNLDSALTEAKRLSDKTRKEAFILSPIRSFRPLDKFIETEFKDDDLPF